MEDQDQKIAGLAIVKNTLCWVGIASHLLALGAFFLDAYGYLPIDELRDGCAFSSWLMGGWGTALLLPMVGFLWPGKPISVALFLMLAIHYVALCCEAPFVWIMWGFGCSGPTTLFG